MTSNAENILTYPPIVPTFPEHAWQLPKILAHQAVARKDKVFLRWMQDGSTVTFGEARDRAMQLACGFSSLGIDKGDRVVLFLANSVDHLLVWFGLSVLGAVDAPINTAYLGDLLVHQVNLVRARYMVVEDSLLERVLAVADRLTHLETLVVRGAGRDLAGQHGSRFRIVHLEAMAQQTAAAPVQRELAVHDPSTILFTSGTTGPSKAVVLCHSQMYFFAEQPIHMHGMTESDIVLAPVPLFHVSGRIFGAYVSLIAGSTYAMYDRFSGSQFVQRLHESGATVAHMLGAMMQMVYNQPPSPRDRGHSLRSVFAAPTPFDIAEAFAKRFGVSRLVEGLGQTEVCQPVITPAKLPRPRGAAGVLMSQYFEARVVDPTTDVEVPIGQVGEYVVRSKQPWLIALGYDNMPEKTLEATRNQWFHTGDAVRRDEHGWYYFVDRIKDCIRRRGENVSSYEIEAVLLKHPGVQDAAALAVPADSGDPEDEILVCLIPNDGPPIRFDELVIWLKERLPAFAVPRYYRLMAEFPKTPNDKVQKAKLRKDGVTADCFDRARMLAEA